MKFEDIKVGDTVYVEDDVIYGWSMRQSFFIPVKVARTTRTQFIIEGRGERKYKKDNGNGIGIDSRAYFLGEKASNWSDEIVKDQTKERDAFRNKITIEKGLVRFIDSIKVNINSSASLEDLMKAKDLLKEAKSLLMP